MTMTCLGTLALFVFQGCRLQHLLSEESQVHKQQSEAQYVYAKQVALSVLLKGDFMASLITFCSSL
jgi:hypothetical protein